MGKRVAHSPLSPNDAAPGAACPPVRGQELAPWNIWALAPEKKARPFPRGELCTESYETKKVKVRQRPSVIFRNEMPGMVIKG